MTRAAICGDRLRPAAAVLGLDDDPAPELLLLDADDPDAVAAASAHPATLPRIVVASGATLDLLRAAGTPHLAASCEPHVLGPLVASVAPDLPRPATRSVVVTALRGGVGRTLLVANVARRCARERAVWAVDATGTGALAWWLRAEPPSWVTLEALSGELTEEHLRVVAAGPDERLRVLGGPGGPPSRGLIAATLDALRASDALVFVDAPLADTARDLCRPEQRVLVLSYGDAASLALLERADLTDAWLIASQAARLGGQAVFRTLPRDERAVAAAMAARGPVGGALGRAYEELATILALDAS